MPTQDHVGIGAAIVVCFLAVTVLAQVLAPHDSTNHDLSAALSLPSPGYLL